MQVNRLKKFFGKNMITQSNNGSKVLDSNEQPSNIVKVFVSSTFKDLEKERSCLAANVFPHLRNFCYKKGLHFQDLDLRWGITEEESKNRLVVRLCLKGIDDSVPYFICILGNRYGWVPSESEINLVDSQTYRNFVKEQVEKEKSITEIEIRYALLHRQKIKPFFFFKTSATSNSDTDSRLLSLKDEIKSDYPKNVFTFSSTEELSDQVYSVITRDIEERFPSASNINTLQEEMQQNNNAWRRLSESMLQLTSFDTCYSQLNKILNDEISLLWITSDNNTSQRYVSANWIKNNTKSHNTFYFDCENTVSKTNSYNILWKIYQRVCYFYSIEELLKYESTENEVYSPIQELFIELERICKNIVVKIIFIIDNIDNCADFSPRFIQIIESLSTKIGIVLLSSNTFYEKWGKVSVFAHHHIPQWSSDEITIFIDKYLEQFGKRLDKKACNKLAGNELLNDMFVLKLALDTLRQYASYDNLDSLLEQIYNANSKENLYSLALSFVKHNHSNEKSLTSRILWLIIESQMGLSINDLKILTEVSTLAIYEIIDVLSLFLSYESNRINITDKQFIQSVKTVFPISNEEINSIDQKLIEFWENEEEIPDEKIAIYGLSELYIKKEEWDKLFKILANPTYFYYYMNNAQELFYERWNTLKKHSSSKGYQYDFPLYRINFPTLDRNNAESVAWSYLSTYQTSLNFKEEDNLLVYLKETEALIKEFKLESTYLASVLNALYARYFLKKNNLSEALSYATYSLTIRKKLYDEEHEFILKAKRLLYQIYNLMGNIQEIKKLISEFERVISISDAIPADECIEIINIVIKYYKINSNYHKIKTYSENLIETTGRYYTKESNEYIMSIYNYCDNMDDINESKDTYSLLKEIVESDYFNELSDNNRKIAIMLYYLKAKISFKKEPDIETSLNSLLKNCLDDIKCKEFVLSNGTHIFGENGLYVEALEWADQEIELCKKSFKDKLGLAYERRGGILHYMKKSTDALESLFCAESEYLKSNSTESLSNLTNLYASIGACYAQISDKRSALYLQKSIDIAENNFGSSGANLALRYKNLGMAYLYICKEYRKSVSALSKAFDLYKEISLQEDITEVFHRLAEACFTAGYFTKAYEMISLFPQSPDNQNRVHAIAQDIQSCSNCLELIKELRQYGMNNFNAQATIKLLATEFFIACFQEGLNPIIEESGHVFVFLEGREYHYTPSEQFCDTAIVRSKINISDITEDKLSKINEEVVKRVVEKEKTEKDETFLVLPDSGNYILLSTFRLGEVRTYREDCLNLLNIATKVIREIEETYP